jgi:hypothetical protein
MTHVDDLVERRPEQLLLPLIAWRAHRIASHLTAT